MRKSGLKYRLFAAYCILLHLLIGAFLWRRLTRVAVVSDPELTSYFSRLVTYHKRSVGMVPPHSVIFIGDSLVQSLCVSAVSSNAVNYGIGSDTTRGVLERLNVYQTALISADKVVLAIGVNDSMHRSPSDAIGNYRKILEQIPCPVVVSSVIPAGNRAWIDDFNSQLEDLAKEFGATYIDNTAVFDANMDGLLDEEFDDGDGVHLNCAGNKAWAANLQR